METLSNLQHHAERKLYNALVVDDNDFDRQRICRFTEKSNLQIATCGVSSISEMQDVISERRYDLIFLDFQLMDGNGLDALRLVQGSRLQNEAGIIMITGDDRTNIAVDSFRNGCHDFVSKSTLSVETMKTAMLRTLDNIHIKRQRYFAEEKILREVRDAISASFRGISGQDILPEVLRAESASTEADLQLVNQIEIEALINALEDNDEFNFKVIN